MQIIQLPSRGPISYLTETAPELMRLRPTVLFLPVYKKTNNKGLCPIYCRITYAGVRAEFSTGITVSKNEFDNGSLLPTAQGFTHKNNELLYIESKLQGIYLKLRMDGAPISAYTLREIYLTPPPKEIYFFDLVKETYKLIVSKITVKSTLKGYSSRYKNIEDFFTAKQLLHLPANSITMETIEQFDCWLQKKGHKHIYINRHIQLLRKVIEKAVGAKKMSHNIISGYEYKYDSKHCDIVFLEKHELSAWEKIILKTKTLEEARDVYIFGCYTGFAHCDIVDFDFNDDVKTVEGKPWIEKARTKSHIEQILPLYKKAEEILKKYNYKLPSPCFDDFNDNLKLIAAKLGIDKNITPHSARKTFSMHRLDEGFSMEAVAKMLGHVNTDQIQNVYGKVTQKRIALEMKRTAA